MKLKITVNKMNTYLNKILREREESVSVYVFYGDHPEWGKSQLMYQTKHMPDKSFGEDDLIEKCRGLINEGWKDVVIERIKTYYTPSKNRAFKIENTMVVQKFKFIK